MFAVDEIDDMLQMPHGVVRSSQAKWFNIKTRIGSTTSRS